MAVGSVHIRRIHSFRDMHCVLISCEIPINKTEFDALGNLLEINIHIDYKFYHAGELAGIFGTQLVFVDSGYTCIGASDIRPYEAQEPTLGLDGMPCGDGKV